MQQFVYMPCVYILLSLKMKMTYTESSHGDEPTSRIKLHNSGKVQSTKFGVPWQLIHEEQYADYTEARKRELFLKTGRGRAIVKQLVEKSLSER